MIIRSNLFTNGIKIHYIPTRDLYCFTFFYKYLLQVFILKLKICQVMAY